MRNRKRRSIHRIADDRWAERSGDPMPIATGDFDSDGDQDLAFISGTTLKIFGQTTTGVFAEAGSYALDPENS